MAKKAPKWTATKQADLAAFFRCSVDTISAWRKKGMPGRRGRYDLAEIVTWLRAEGPWRPKQETHSDADPLLSDGGKGSDNLEEYRKWKAALARLEYEKTYESLVGKDLVGDDLTLAVEILQRAADRLDQTHGPAARETLMEALEDFGRQVASKYGDPAAPA